MLCRISVAFHAILSVLTKGLAKLRIDRAQLLTWIDNNALSANLSIRAEKADHSILVALEKQSLQAGGQVQYSKPLIHFFEYIWPQPLGLDPEVSGINSNKGTTAPLECVGVSSRPFLPAFEDLV